MADVLLAAAIREGHDRLLRTFREFSLAEDLASGDESQPDALRGAAAFLRQEILPFSRWEESVLGAHGEDAALEHAFLAAEIDAFGRAVDEYLRGDSVRKRAAEAAMLRHVHRIEAVLELHMIRDDEADAGAGSVAASPNGSNGAHRATHGRAAAARTGHDTDVVPAHEPGLPASRGATNSHGTRCMQDDELRQFLATQRWAVFATSAGARPYAVPVSYGYDGRHFFVATGPGRKASALEENSNVCLTITDIRPDGKAWRSAVVTGRAEWVGDLRGRIAAFDVLRRQTGAVLPRSPGELLKLARASVLRIVADEVTGRAKDAT